MDHRPSGSRSPKPRPAAPPEQGGLLGVKSWAAIILAFAASLLYREYHNRPPAFPFTPAPNPNPSCKVYHADVLHNCEDFRFFTRHSLLPKKEYAILSCDGDRPKLIVNPHDPTARQGELFLWDVEHPDSEPIRLLAGVPGDFHPVGISIAPLSDTSGRIFATNRGGPSGASVEVIDFDAETHKALHRGTIRHKSIKYPNGIVAINPTNFIVTNEKKYSQLPEIITGLALSEIVHVSLPEEIKLSQGDPVVTTLTKVASANGIAVDPSTRRLWIASMTYGIYEYSYETFVSGAINIFLNRVYRTPFLPDNLAFTDDGSLLVSGHPDAIKLLKRMRNMTLPVSGSWTGKLLEDQFKHASDEEKAVRVQDAANQWLGRTKGSVWKSVFWDDGSFYGAVSTGATFAKGQKFVAVSLVEDGAILCDSVGNLEPMQSRSKSESSEKTEL